MCMIPNCEGCKCESEEAYNYQQKGLYLATCIKIPNSYPKGRRHFYMILVNDEGKIKIQ